ncbi:MAG: N-glycosylase/DNA lyase [Acidilobaceae archaeon]|nr:N-glycosylase/DNA lyase [Acidilobaceae archaeon]
MRRAEEVAGLVARIGREGIMRLEELADPQYAALQRIASARGKGVAAAYAVLVSLASYRLTMRGEEWWGCLADFAERRSGRSLEEIGREVELFLLSCKGSALSREAKLERVRRALRGARRELERLLREPEIVYSEPEGLLRSLSAALGASSWRKTLVFSLKMAYYATRGPGERRTIEKEIPIPVDTRVACATFSSMLLEAASYREIMVKQRPAQEAWREVARLSGVPEVNLDTLLWLTGWAPRDLELQEAHAAVARLLSAVVSQSEAFEIARSLYLRRCI